MTQNQDDSDPSPPPAPPETTPPPSTVTTTPWVDPNRYVEVRVVGTIAMSGATGDGVSPAGKIYQPMVGAILAAEADRRKTLERRGGTLLTASTSLVTLIFAVSVIVTGKSFVFANHCAVTALCLALGSFVISAVIAIVVQTHGYPYKVIDGETLMELAGTNEAWAESADYALRRDVSQRVVTICSLRDGNETMAKHVAWSLRFQVLAIGLLSVSVGLELYGRI